MMKLDIPSFDQVVERKNNDIQFGIFDSADNVKWVVRDHHRQWIFASRCELKGRYDYVVKFVNRNGEWVNRADDTIYKVMPDGTLELVY